MIKNLRILVAMCVMISIIGGSNVVFAAEQYEVSPGNEGIAVESEVDDYVYQMIEDYKNGTFVERNDLPELDIRKLFNDTQPSTLNESDEYKVEYLYDNRMLEDGTYAATKVTMIEDLEDYSGSTRNGVKIQCTVFYSRLDMDDWFDYVMLLRTRGTVVEETGDYECTSMVISYKVYGDAYDKNGDRHGFKGDDGSSTINNPIVGADYVYSGPADYYYNMGAGSSFVGASVEAEIQNASGDTKTFETEFNF